MAKIGRNQPCPCGQEKKYKHCCGSIANEPIRLKPTPMKELPQEAQLAILRHFARERIIEEQQGKGRAFVTTEMNGQRVIAVGNTITSSAKWRTPADFLSDFMKAVLTGEWGNAELAKPFEERHILVQWYDAVCKFQAKHLDGSGAVRSMPFYGVFACYLGLANSLFLLKQNVALHDHLLNRLKDPKQFQGAYYELIVFSALIRAGFTIEMEDEQDQEIKHPECYAISPITEKKYFVEAKMRSIKGVMGQDQGSDSTDITARATVHLNKALEKDNPQGVERMIFIDLNGRERPGEDMPHWVEKLARRFDQKERDLPEDKKAYVFVTNFAYHHMPDSEMPLRSILAYGLGIPDFSKPGMKTPSQMYKEKLKHQDAIAVFESLGKYPQIPPTFDGQLPCEINGDPPRTLLGESYDFDGTGVKGIVIQAVVFPGQRKALYQVKSADGSVNMVYGDLTEQQALDYERHPEAFFGAIQEVPKNTTDPEEMFAAWYPQHKDTTKERLLELMAHHRDIDNHKHKPREELVDLHLDRLIWDFKNRVSAESQS